MGYYNAFDISASGMTVQKTILDTIALNLANVSTTRSSTGGPYKPLEVVVGQKTEAHFDRIFNGYQRLQGGVQVIDIQPKAVEPRLVFDPQHPDANEDGYVAYPDINPVSMMVELMAATRSYEANVRAINAAKTMALRALEIGE